MELVMELGVGSQVDLAIAAALSHEIREDESFTPDTLYLLSEVVGFRESEPTESSIVRETGLGVRAEGDHLPSSSLLLLLCSGFSLLLSHLDVVSLLPGVLCLRKFDLFSRSKNHEK